MKKKRLQSGPKVPGNNSFSLFASSVDLFEITCYGEAEGEAVVEEGVGDAAGPGEPGEGQVGPGLEAAHQHHHTQDAPLQHLSTVV